MINSHKLFLGLLFCRNINYLLDKKQKIFSLTIRANIDLLSNLFSLKLTHSICVPNRSSLCVCSKRNSLEIATIPLHYCTALTVAEFHFATL